MAEKKITFEDLTKVNSEIVAQDIKGKDYAAVNERIKAFRKLFPTGTITTEIVSHENGVVVFKASALNEAGELLATGHAYEKEGSTFINKTSYIENAETSAVGRCLGMLGIGIDISLASYEETANAIKQQETPATETKPQPAPAKQTAKPEQPKQTKRSPARQKLADYCKENGLTPEDKAKIVAECGLNKDSTEADYEKALIAAIDIKNEKENQFMQENEPAGTLPFEL